MTKVFNFKEADVITCHAWNKDYTQLALAPRSNELYIYKHTNGEFTFLESLKGHTHKINAVDWCHLKNRIITAGADRNVYVWNLINGKWTKTLVIMRSNRAAVSVEWSPNGEKFAVGCASRLLAVAYFDEKNNWWTSKLIKKRIRSTVTSVSWTPNSDVIACGTSGFKTRIFGAIIKDYDKNVSSSVWSDDTSVGTMIQEYTCEGWVNDLKFSPTGDKIVWICNNSSISLVAASSNTVVQKVDFNHLPLMSLIWTNNDNIGFDTDFYTFKVSQNKLTQGKNFDNEDKSKCHKVSAMSHFKSLDTFAKDASGSSNDCKHNSTVIEIRKFGKGGQDFTSISNEGKIIIWNKKDICSKFSGLTI